MAKKKVTVAKTAAELHHAEPESTVKLVSDLHNEIEAKDDELASLKDVIKLKDEYARGLEQEISEINAKNRKLEAALKTSPVEHTTPVAAPEPHGSHAERLANLENLMRPFILAAKGQGHVTDADWQRLGVL